MSIKYDLIGQRFGQLVVTDRVYVNGVAKWKCICDCGNKEYYAVSNNLISGKTTQCCECGKKMTGIKKRKNRIGERVGHLTIVDVIYNYNDTKKTMYVWDCDCGNKGIIRGLERKSEYASCGCQRKASVISWKGKDINGQRFGRLTVIETLWEETPPKVKCLCDCGNIKICNKGDVMTNHTQSCGCLQKDNCGKANFVDSAGYISDSGVEILKPHHQNRKKQWVWECRCGYCDKIFLDLPARIKNNHTQSCGCVKTSIREDYIENLLINHNFLYETQYSFPDCKNKYVLRFDFAIFNDKELQYLIEYDGEQHYNSISIFGGDDSLLETQKRDKIKDDYCREHNIDLIRLPYYLSNEEIKEKIINIKKA